MPSLTPGQSLRYTHLWTPLFTPAYLAIAAAPWAKYRTYYVGDIVSFNGVAYQALLAHAAAHEVSFLKTRELY